MQKKTAEILKFLPDRFGVKRAAFILDVSMMTIRNAIYSKSLRAVKDKGKWYINKEDFNNFLSRKRYKQEIIEKLKEDKSRIYLTIKQIMKLVHVSYITVYRWACVYMVFPQIYKIAGKILIPKLHFIHFLINHPGKIIFSHVQIGY